MHYAEKQFAIINHSRIKFIHSLTEQLDESLVEFQFLLGLDADNADDALYIPEKKSAEYDSRPQFNKIRDKMKWPELKYYCDSPAWKRIIYL